MNARQTSIEFADGTSSSTGYDDAGRMTSKTDQAGKITWYGYDKLGRLTSVTQDPVTPTNPNGLNLVTNYGYDELGSRVSQTDANNHKTSYDYDQLGRRVKRTLPLGQSETYAYNPTGTLKTRTDFDGRTTTYDYDDLNRLLSKTADPYFAQHGLGAAVVSFTYTADGRRETMTDASGKTTYVYDPVSGRLTSKQTPEGTLSYTYNNTGNVLSITSSNTNGAAMAYTYDELNRLSTVTVPGQSPTTYGYEEVGNLGGYAYPNGVATSYTYDKLNRLTDMSVKKAGTALSSYTYTLAAAGNRTKIVELSGRTVEYGYDNLYRLKSETISAATGGTFACGTNNEQCGAVSYEYDAVGNRKQRTSTLAAIPTSGLLYYDANDRTSTDTYDDNGNTISQAGIGNQYDFENRLIKHGEMTFTYDGDGNRVAKVVGGVTTQFLVDTANPTGYAQVIDELTNGTVSRTYAYGLDLISQSQTIDSAWKTSWYGYDGHGSVRVLSDDSGSVTDTYTYDAFGNLINQTGSTPNNYLYAGEQYDWDLGLYYNRARYLDVRVGRFWGMDTWEDPAAIGEPLALHRYLYASADPINTTDPSGHFSITEQMETAAIYGVLTAMATVAIRGVGEHPKDASCSERFGYCLYNNGGIIAVAVVAIALGIDWGGEPLPKTAAEFRGFGDLTNVSDVTTRLSRFNLSFNQWVKDNVDKGKYAWLALLGVQRTRAFRVVGRVLSAVGEVTNVAGAFLVGYTAGLIPSCALAAYFDE